MTEEPSPDFLEKKIALIIVAIWLGVVACKLSCTNVSGVHKVQNVQMAQSLVKADSVVSVEQIMELFDASQQDVSYHINQIYADGEQDAERTHKKFLLVRQEGNRSVKRQMSHYNLDMIIAVGYRVKSPANSPRSKQ